MPALRTVGGLFAVLLFVATIRRYWKRDVSRLNLIITALISSQRNAPIPHDLVVFGEVGLLGEIRSVSQADLRAREAAALGFRRVVVPHANAAEIHADVDVIAVRRVEEVAERVVGGSAPGITR